MSVGMWWGFGAEMEQEKGIGRILGLFLGMMSLDMNPIFDHFEGPLQVPTVSDPSETKFFCTSSPQNREWDPLSQTKALPVMGAGGGGLSP